MKYDKSYLRKISLLKRKKKYISAKKFNFNLIFKLIKKFYSNKKIIIAGYYPSNYEVDILSFLKEASKRKFKVVLPVIKSSNRMSFKLWNYGDPLYVSKFGTLEPQKFKKDIIDRKRISKILKNINNKSKRKNIDPKITKKIWSSMIRAYIDYEFRNFKKK